MNKSSLYSYLKTLLFMTALLVGIVTLNFLREEGAVSYTAYFMDRLPKLILISAAASALLFLLRKRFKREA